MSICSTETKSVQNKCETEGKVDQRINIWLELLAIQILQHYSFWFYCSTLSSWFFYFLLCSTNPHHYIRCSNGGDHVILFFFSRTIIPYGLWSALDHLVDFMFHALMRSSNCFHINISMIHAFILIFYSVLCAPWQTETGNKYVLYSF